MSNKNENATVAKFSKFDQLNKTSKKASKQKKSGKRHQLWPGLVPKKFHPKLSHRILRHMHGVLNIDIKN